MKILYPIFFLYLLTTTAIAQNVAISRELSIGKTINLYSNILQENRTLNIYLPPEYRSKANLPVIYLLDGSMDEDFIHVVGLVQFFNLQFHMPPTIVIGIANVDRKRDFTFHTELTNLKDHFPTAGHSEKFIRFIENELQPFIHENFSSNDTTFLIGQSLGGLLATEILFKHPNLFSHYLIVSPSLWWDNKSLLQHTLIHPDLQLRPNPFIYISVGAKEDKIMKQVARKLYKSLQHVKAPNLKLRFNIMKNENHASILHNSLYAAFQILYH